MIPGLLRPVNPSIVKLKTTKRNPNQNMSGPISTAMSTKYNSEGKKIKRKETNNDFQSGPTKIFPLQ